MHNILDAAPVGPELYRQKCNTYRPHSGLDYLTPSAFAAQCREQADGIPLNEKNGVHNRT